MPRLVRFYGGDPMTWLEGTPSAVITACLEMLPKLEAEEQIDGVNVTVLGSGNAEADSARVLKQKMEIAAAGRAGRKKADPGVLAAQGFAVRRVKRKKKAASE